MDPVVLKRGLAAVNTIASVLAAMYFADKPDMRDAVMALVANAALIVGWVFLRRPGDLPPLPGGPI